MTRPALLALPALALMLLSGCASMQQRHLAEEQAWCVLAAVENPSYSEHEKAFIAQGCHDLYLLKGGRR